MIFFFFDNLFNTEHNCSKHSFNRRHCYTPRGILGIQECTAIVNRSHLMGGAGVFGDGFGTFRNGVFRKFSWKHKADRRLDFTWRQSLFAWVACKTDGLGCNALKGVVDERVHDGHGFATDTGVWVHLFENFVDVRGKWLDSLLSAFGSLGCLGLSGFLCWCLWHDLKEDCW